MTTEATSPSPVPTTQLPATIRAFLAAHVEGDADGAATAFTADARITDEGHTFRGAEQVRAFLGTAGSEYTYTTELTGAERIDDTHWVATNHLEGDFPGGVVDLRYRFTLEGDLISNLDIAP